MDNKRKASSANGGGSEGERSAKRRFKVPPPPAQFDLMKGETPESTTSYGLSFLEQLRRTQDKSGRLVAGYFEELLPRKGNEDYYAKTPMPVSLRTLEQKLHRREFKNMAELESWLRRMVKNAKDYYSRHSDVFEDAERIRKAVSNYMTKTNPAYKKIASYSCQPAPIPDTPMPTDEGSAAQDQGDEDAEAEPESDSKPTAKTDKKEVEEDEEEEEDDDDDDGGDDGESDAEAVPKRRSAGRPSIRGKTKPDHEYEGVPYKGLTFQQAQEKIVEEMIRKPDDEEPEWAKFEAFLNLPPRSLKEYFSIIQNPLSLKGLQKLVKGIHGRAPPTGVSEFKGWAAFEERASLLWDNAHYFNEEGSEIYNQATEMKEFFESELAKAKAVVQEPPQPKIKLRVPQAQEAPTPTALGPKKITIHVGGSRAQTTASPAPQASTPATGAATASDGRANGVPPQRFSGPNGVSGVPMTLPQLEHVRSTSGAVASPSPPITGVKQELANGQSPAVTPRLSGAPSQPSPFAPPPHLQPQFLPPGASVQNGYHPPPVERQVERASPIYNKVKRAPGRGLSDALITSLHIRGHPNLPLENGVRFSLSIPADPVYAQQNTTVHVPNYQYKLQVIPKIAPLERQNRAYRLFVVCNGSVLSRTAPLPIPGDTLLIQDREMAMVFDANLGLGMNEIQVHLVAALPKGQKLPGGEECEVEIFRVVAQLLRA